MKNKMKDLKNSMHELKVSLSPEEGKKYFDLAYKEINKKADVPGFRRGKAPRNVLESNYSDLAKEKVINFAVPECYNKAVKGTDIEMISEPLLKDIDFSSDLSFSFTVHIPVKPKIKLSKYKGLKLKKDSAKVTSEELDDMLENLREQHAEFKSSDKQKVAEGKYVVCDVKCEVDGNVIEDKKNINLPIKEKFPIPELIKGLKETKAGEEKIIDAVLPEGIYDDKYSGEKGKFYIKVHEIKEKVLPKLDDSFAKKVGQIDKIEELKDRLEKNIKVQKERKQRENIETNLINELLKYNKFDVPYPLIKKEKESLLKQTEKQLVSKGIKGQQLEDYKKNMMKDIEKKAEKRVKTYFLLERISSEEDIDVSDKEVKQEIDKLATSTKQSSEDLEKYLKKEKLLYNLKAETKARKIMDFLLDNAKIKEK